MTVFYGLEQHRETLIKLLSAFSNMSEGQLGQIPIGLHRIELTSKDTRPVHNTPYQAGAKYRQFSATQIDKMIRQDVIEPACGILVVLAPKKTIAHSVFVSTAKSRTQELSENTTFYLVWMGLSTRWGGSHFLNACRKLWLLEN